MGCSSADVGHQSLLLSSRLYPPTPLQDLIMRQAVAQKERLVQPDTVNPVEALLFQGRRCIMSAKASQHHDANDLKRTASAVAEAASRLWQGLLEHLERLQKQGWKTVFSIKRRYDETPLGVRVSESDSQDFSSTTNNPAKGSHKRVGKIMQSEMQVSALLQHPGPVPDTDNRSAAGGIGSGQFLQIVGKVPCWLQCLKSTTAPHIAKSQQQLLASLRNLRPIANLFKMKHSFVTSDRYTGNLAAERHLQSLDPTWGLTHVFCHVHQLASCEKALSDLVAGHLGGLVSLGMCSRHAGALKDLRKALMAVFREDLCVRIGPPQGETYRKAIHDLFLPLHDDTCTAAERDEQSKKHQVAWLTRCRRRQIINHFLNGDLQSSQIVHYVDRPRDRATVLLEIEELLVPAMLPSPCPVLNRSKWLGAEAAFSWAGVLLSHHDLLPRMIRKWRHISDSAVSDMAAEASVAAGMVTGLQWDDSWVRLAGQEASRHTGPADSGARPQPEHEQDQDEEFMAPVARDPLTGDVDWQEHNKATIGKACAWTATSPAHAFIIANVVWTPVLKLMQETLFLGSESWDRKQQVALADGRERCFRVVELFHGTSLNKFWDALEDLFQNGSPAVPVGAWSESMRCLMFRLLSRAGAAVSQIFAAQHKMSPFVLFGALAGKLQELKSLPVCMRDELTSLILEKFPEDEDLLGNECQNVLAAAASQIDSDIVGLEVRHASVRRVSMLRSCQTWTMDLESLGAEWLLRQQVILREPKTQKIMVPSKKRKKEKKKRVSKGGPWRAYLHLHCRGQKLDTAKIKEASAQYQRIKAAGGAPWDELVNLGLVMLLAGRAGKKAFKRKPSLRRPLFRLRQFQQSAEVKRLKERLAELNAGSRAYHFHAKFAKLLRPYLFPPRSKSKQSKKQPRTKARLAMMKGFLVLQLHESLPGVDDAQPVQDLRHWLVRAEAVETLCERFGPWARVARQLAGEDEHQPRPVKLNVESPLTFRRCLEHFSEQLDLRKVYHATFWLLQSDPEPCLTSREMAPRHVEVAKYSFIPTMQVWKGQDREAQDRLGEARRKEKQEGFDTSTIQQVAIPAKETKNRFQQSEESPDEDFAHELAAAAVPQQHPVEMAEGDEDSEPCEISEAEDDVNEQLEEESQPAPRGLLVPMLVPLLQEQMPNQTTQQTTFPQLAGDWEVQRIYMVLFRKDKYRPEECVDFESLVQDFTERLAAKQPVSTEDLLLSKFHDLYKAEMQEELATPAYAEHPRSGVGRLLQWEKQAAVWRDELNVSPSYKPLEKLGMVVEGFVSRNERVDSILNLVVAEKIHELPHKNKAAIMSAISRTVVDVSQNPDRRKFTTVSGVQPTLTCSSYLVHLGRMRIVLPCEHLFWQGYNKETVCFPDKKVCSGKAIRTLAGEGMFLPSLGLIAWSLYLNQLFRVD
ncbi:unnamed protein product [Symbiodinium sp. CCMP2592]|nr:unnamed protein product [Symbiodinium sp. CCMP2592]